MTGYSVHWVHEIARRYRGGARGHRRPPPWQPGGGAAVGCGAAGAVTGGAGRSGPGRRPVDLSQRGGLDEPDAGAAGQRAARLGVDAPPRLHPATAPPARDPRRSRGAGGVQKGGLAAQVAAVRHAHPTATVTLWAEDEHRLGPAAGGAPGVGAQGAAPHRPGPPQVRLALRLRLRPAPHRAELVVSAADGDAPRRSPWRWPPSPAMRASMPPIAPCWSSIRPAGTPVPRLVLPEGIELVFLPAASPELQPAERLWALVDEPVANRAFPDLDALEAVLVERCRTLEADPRASKPTPTSTGGRLNHDRHSHRDYPDFVSDDHRLGSACHHGLGTAQANPHPYVSGARISRRSSGWPTTYGRQSGSWS